MFPLNRLPKLHRRTIGIIAGTGCMASLVATPTFAVAPPQAPSAYSGSAVEDISKACETGNFDSFFQIFVEAPEIRARYTDNAIGYTLQGSLHRVISTRKYAPKAYTQFPIRADGAALYPTKSDPKSSGKREFIDVSIDDTSGGIATVEWAVVTYDGTGATNGSRGTMIDGDGHTVQKDAHPRPDGRLTFKPKDGCWVLSQDTRFVR